jgi:hypothetical protein
MQMKKFDIYVELNDDDDNNNNNNNKNNPN